MASPCSSSTTASAAPGVLFVTLGCAKNEVDTDRMRALALRAGDQTLTDDHADEAVAAILGALAREYGAVIR